MQAFLFLRTRDAKHHESAYLQSIIRVRRRMKRLVFSHPM